MSEMVERVARAIHLKRLNLHFTRWEDCIEEYRTDTMRDARAAIEAMRVPTEGMVTAAIAPYVYGNDEKMNGAFRAAIAGYWQAMVDEALE